MWIIPYQYFIMFLLGPFEFVYYFILILHQISLFSDVCILQYFSNLEPSSIKVQS